MVDLLGPGDAGASPTHSTTTDVTAPVAGDTWHFDCVGGVAGTATPIVSTWLNRINQQMRASIRSAGIPTSNAYDEMLSWAMQSGYANWVGFFAGTANALTGAAPNGPLTIPGGTVVCGQISAPNNTGATTFNWSGLGAQTVKRIDGSACTGGEIRTGDFLVLRWDGGAWRIVSPPPAITATAIAALVFAIDVQQFDATGTWTAPAGFVIESRVLVEIWGGGGGPSNGSGGNGGAYERFETYLGALPSSCTCLVGAGGAASDNSSTAANAAAQAGTSVFAYGLYGNLFRATGGWFAVGIPGGTPAQLVTAAMGLGGAGGNPSSYPYNGVNAFFGGAGGAGWNGSSGAAGASVFGGSGGAINQAGFAPGGGGGCAPAVNGVGGAGASGRIRVTTIQG